MEVSFRLLLVCLTAFGLAAADHYILGGALAASLDAIWRAAAQVL